MASFYVAVGAFSVRGSKGISVVTVDSDSGAMACVSNAESESPNFLTISPCRRYVYAANEIRESENRSIGAVTSFGWNRASGVLSPIDRRSIPGASQCHLAVDPSGRWLVTSNYADGAHAVLAAGGDGTMGDRVSVFANQGVPGPGQSSGHAHSATFDGPSVIYACDLGLDRVISYRLTDDGRLRESECGSVVMAPGAGPRHLTLHPRLPIAYVINELDSTICVLGRTSAGQLSVLQTVSTLPNGYADRSYCADIHLGDDEHYLYGSNRGHDSLAAFVVGRNSGLLSGVGHVSTGGHWPRNFCVLQGGLILVANERSDSITAFRVGTDGIPAPTGQMLSLPSPTCILPLD